MANYDIRPLQLRLLDVLMVIHDVCQQHNLRYYLVDGTLLGAVRHQGFIPWDDDIDIYMPRKDYELLIEHAEEWLPKRYEFICWERDKKYPFHYGKIQDSETTLIDRPYRYYL
ncbi:MAG: LicD family protein, partial [Bacteroidales bacterium]|nr:LicD family protein [Bacteroidales bacterium]